MYSQQDQSREWEAEGGDIDVLWAGTYNPNIQCWLCCGYGHPKSKCPLNPQNKGKGKWEKGQDKGKGKGKDGGLKGFPKEVFPTRARAKDLIKERAQEKEHMVDTIHTILGPTLDVSQRKRKVKRELQRIRLQRERKRELFKRLFKRRQLAIQRIQRQKLWERILERSWQRIPRHLLEVWQSWSQSSGVLGSSERS